jgi:hypothetical protein
MLLQDLRQGRREFNGKSRAELSSPTEPCGAFCRNNTAKLTLEDVLPMWYLKRRQGLGLVTHVSWSGAGIEHRHQSPLKVGVKVVCGPCNNVWMSDIQREASKFLEKMIDGQPTILDSDGQRAVATWLMMTAFTWQFAVSGGKPIPEHFTRDFYTMSAPRKPPAGTTVWIGRYSGQSRMATYCCDVARTIQADGESVKRIDINRDPPPFGATICLENFVAQVAGFSIPQTQVRFALGDAAKFWHPIWPLSSGLVSWPPQESIDEPVLAMLERAFNPLEPK